MRSICIIINERNCSYCNIEAMRIFGSTDVNRGTGISPNVPGRT